MTEVGPARRAEAPLRSSCGVERTVPEEPVPPAVVVAPVELDFASAPGFARGLDAALTAGVDLVVADLGSTTFCDSSGLKVLVHAARRAKAHGQRLEVRNPSRMLCRMAGIVGAASLLGLPPA